jgi:nanoRNase/pAp phosphatase (c-di-AMP/oligoRNAs hydrolase)
MSKPRTAKSDHLLKTLAGHEEVFVVTHNNPDPDAMAAGWAVWLLAKERLGANVRLLAGGFVSRAENRHMVDLLEPPLELVRDMTYPGHGAVVLVDCQPGNQNYLFDEEGAPVAVVIDHHRGGRWRAPFRDVRPRVAASSSIAASYLREQRIEPGNRLATALLFAIRTETHGSETHFSRLDRTVLPWLSQYSDPSWLAEIESAPLSSEYYSDLVLALQGTFLYDDTALCLLPRASGPEIVGEVADLLIRCRSIWRVLCGAVVGDDLLLSIRTDREDEDAALLARHTLAGIGRGGGHRHRAGGKIPDVGPKISEALQGCSYDMMLRRLGYEAILRDAFPEVLPTTRS